MDDKNLDRSLYIDTDALDLEKLKKHLSQAPSKSNAGSGFSSLETLIFRTRFPEDLRDIDLRENDEKFAKLEDSYEVLDILAEGSQGKIYTGKDKCLHREVAIKKLKYSKSKHQFLQFFLNEARLTAQLDHPSIVPIYSLNQSLAPGTEDSYELSFSMKMIRGLTLYDYLRDLRKSYEEDNSLLSLESEALSKRLESFLKICDAISYSHDKKIFHRDLKPLNIMIGFYREVYVMDWGIAYSEMNPDEVPDGEKKKQAVVGTVGFIDPHTIYSSAPNAQSDIFSLAMILYETVCLKRGFSGTGAESVIAQAINGCFPKVQHYFKDHKVDQDLVAIIEKARHPDCSIRYRSVEEMAVDIRHYLRDDATVAYPDNLSRAFQRWVRKHSKIATIFGLASILVLAFLVIFNLHEKNLSIQASHLRETSISQLQSQVSEKAYHIDTQITKIENLLSSMSEKMSFYQKKNIKSKNIKIYSSTEFAKLGGFLKNSRPADSYNGEFINVDTMIYKLPPKVSLASVKGNIQTLYSFREDFLKIILKSRFASSSFIDNPEELKQEIYNKNLPIKWIYSGFENGAFVSYPGKGTYPESYDHRQRPWYTGARNKTGLSWGQPYHDIGGLGLALPCTFTLLDDKKEFYGVVALDLTLDFIIEKFMQQNEGSKQSFQEAAILDNNGTVIISSKLLAKNNKSIAMNNQSIELKQHEDKELIDAIQKGGKQYFFREINGEKFIYLLARIPSLNWYYFEKIHFAPSKEISE